jgi:hypothetical protein
MAALTIDTIFDAAARILLREEKSIGLVFSRNGVCIRFPTTRRLAEFLSVPHYYVLPFFAMMEQEALVTRAERVGIHTTAKGSAKLLGLIVDQYRSEGEALLGTVILGEVTRRACASLQVS